MGFVLGDKNRVPIKIAIFLFSALFQNIALISFIG
jgi:hypothetical protein